MLRMIVEHKQETGKLALSVAAGTWINTYMDTMSKFEIAQEFNSMFDYDSNIGQYSPKE